MLVMVECECVCVVCVVVSLASRIGGGYCGVPNLGCPGASRMSYLLRCGIWGVLWGGFGVHCVWNVVECGGMW